MTVQRAPIAEDPEIMARLVHHAYYDANRLHDPRFTAMWDEVPQADKDHAAAIGLQIVEVVTTRPELSDPRLNVNVYEALKNDLAFGVAVGRMTYEAVNSDSTAGLFTGWEGLDTETKSSYIECGFRVLSALITDYTTPGCKCDFCMDPPTRDDTSGKPIMCRQRWEALPREIQWEIADSMSD